MALSVCSFQTVTMGFTVSIVLIFVIVNTTPRAPLMTANVSVVRAGEVVDVINVRKSCVLLINVRHCVVVLINIIHIHVHCFVVLINVRYCAVPSINVRYCFVSLMNVIHCFVLLINIRYCFCLLIYFFTILFIHFLLIFRTC